MKVLITGGAGFIGVNIALHHLSKDDKVVILDDLSRPGADKNIKFLSSSKFLEFYKDRVETHIDRVLERNQDIDIIYHMAAQTAVTKSIEDPINDFMVNAWGTFNLLDAARYMPSKPFIIYASTNKVYGEAGGYGVKETQPVDFHSPYGCSKGAADQYVRDYARIYGLDTVVFRQSCIYGPYQQGVEDQGWLSWFCKQFIADGKINIYGDGEQIRDVLYIDDLIDLYEQAFENREISRGQIYNAGGGPENTLSLLKLIDILESISGKKIPVEFHPARAGDQKVYVSDISKATHELKWKPFVAPLAGVQKLYEWTMENP